MNSNGFYHVSSLAYLPNLLKTREFGTAVEHPFRCEERIRKVLTKKRVPLEKIEEVLPREMERKEDYLKDVHYYFWVTDSFDYAIKKAGIERKRVVYLDTPFSSKYGGAQPIIYALSGSISRDLKLQPEGVVRHRQILRYLRAKISGLNFVTKEHVPLSNIEFAVVDQEDASKVSKFLIENDFNLPVIPMNGLANGKSSDFNLELVIEGSKELLRQPSLS